MRQRAVDFVVQRVGFREIHDADRAPPRLVLIGGADAPHGCADLGGAGRGAFPVGVELPVQRQDQRRVLGDLEIVGRDLDALPFEDGDLLDEVVGVDDDAVADDRELARPHDARGQQREFVHLAVDDERVAGVVAALKADDDIGLNRQPVDDLALTLIAPLGADDDDIGHCGGSNPDFFSRGPAFAARANKTPAQIPKRSARGPLRMCISGKVVGRQVWAAEVHMNLTGSTHFTSSSVWRDDRCFNN